jgi:hypothetical protein
LVDWRADGWHWRQNASYNHIVNGVTFKKVPFYCAVGKEINGIVPITKSFLRDVFFHPTIPHRVLIAYSGDESEAEEHCHGNAQTEKKKNENFIPTRNSTKEKLRNSTGCPINVYRELLAYGPADLKEQAVQLPRDVEQVRNFQKNQKGKKKKFRHFNAHVVQIRKFHPREDPEWDDWTDEPNDRMPDDPDESLVQQAAEEDDVVTPSPASSTINPPNEVVAPPPPTTTRAGRKVVRPSWMKNFVV